MEGLSLLTAMLGAEVCGAASPEQADAFFTAVGARLAGLLRVDDIGAIEMLAGRVNQFWQTLGLGDVDMTLTQDGVRIRHHGMPETLEGDFDGCWATMAPALLKGAYDAWFRAIGSGESLHTELLGWEDGVVDLHHGR